jgi:hypothetical protein
LKKKSEIAESQGNSLVVVMMMVIMMMMMMLMTSEGCLVVAETVNQHDA